jgi:two-component system, NarL family, response regulator LiaR
MPVQASHRVLVAHPEPIVRYGLRSLIEKEPDLQVIGEAEDGPGALRLIRHLRPDLVLIGATPLLSDAVQHTAVIVIAGENEEALALAAIRAGAAAYLFRDCHVDDILRALRGAAAGQVVLPRSATRIAHDHRFERLSDREIEVVQLVCRGMANKQLAHELGITLSTVKTHVSAILAKLELSSRTQLALLATTRSARASLERGLDRLTPGVSPQRVS